MSNGLLYIAGLISLALAALFAVPYFVDRKTGTLCAVGFLLASTGRADIVDRVAGVNNNVYVAELAGDTAFTAWLVEQGITLDEAARIQVPYWGDESRR